MLDDPAQQNPFRNPDTEFHLHVLEELFTLFVISIDDRSLVGELFLLGHVVVVLKAMAVKRVAVYVIADIGYDNIFGFECALVSETLAMPAMPRLVYRSPVELVCRREAPQP